MSMRIYLLGFMGAGKTYWGQKLKSTLDLPFYDLDQVIEAEEGLNIPEIFEKFGENYFRSLETEYLKKVSENENVLVSCGGGTPCFMDNMSLMKELGLTIWLNASPGIMVDRVKEQKNIRPLLKNLNEEQLKEYVCQKLEERKPFYGQAQLIIDPIKFDVHSLTEKIQSCTKLI
ncbi:MAG TPA: shikimate kinase [Chitinophagaceae bacterium]|nr:shikimate kinase [Chitinophagaceae bacterium]